MKTKISYLIFSLLFMVLTPSIFASQIFISNPDGLRRELISVNYEDATKIVEVFTAQNPLGEKGSLKVDTRTNILIANLTEENLTKLRQLVEKMDILVRQVQLEARIIAVDSDYIVTLKEQINSIGLDLALNTMQKQGKGEVISQPKVTTTNKETAKIMGKEICYCPANEPRTPTLLFNIIPEIISNQQVKLNIQFTIIDYINKTQQKIDTIIKTVPDNQIILLDVTQKLSIFVSNKNQRLIIFITPKILKNASPRKSD